VVLAGNPTINLIGLRDVISSSLIRGQYVIRNVVGRNEGVPIVDAVVQPEFKRNVDNVSSQIHVD